MKLDIGGEVHIYLHNVPDASLVEALSQLTKGVKKMATDLTALTAEVARNTEVDQSAIALLNGLAQQIEDLKTDPVALQALADKMRGSSDELAAAVQANTPAAP